MAICLYAGDRVRLTMSCRWSMGLPELINSWVVRPLRPPGCYTPQRQLEYVPRVLELCLCCLSTCVLCQCLYVVRDIARSPCFSSLLAERVRCGRNANHRNSPLCLLSGTVWVPQIFYIFRPFLAQATSYQVPRTIGHTKRTVKTGTVKSTGPYNLHSCNLVQV